jgi:hypothetical protein
MAGHPISSRASTCRDGFFLSPSVSRLGKPFSGAHYDAHDCSNELVMTEKQEWNDSRRAHETTNVNENSTNALRNTSASSKMTDERQHEELEES